MMDIVCSNCKTKLTLPDHKVPKGKKASFLCPRCKHRIQVPATGEYLDGMPMVSRKYDAADKPFDFVDDGRKTALVCMKDKTSEPFLERSLEAMGHVVKSAEDVEQALLNMRYHLFDIVVVEDGFDAPGQPGVLDSLCRLEMATRRRIFVVLVAPKYRTMDNMAAFHESVNLVVGGTSFSEMEKILVRGLQEHERFYAVFNDSLKEAGKA